MNNETTAIFNINMVGTESGNPYHGDFKVRTLLTRRQLALADEIRRDILGKNPEGASARVAADAFVAGQLSLRVIEAPEWFKNGGIGGIDLPDINVLEEVFAKAIEAEEERKSKLVTAGDKAADKLKKKSEKA
jgi:hypothetical protein